VQEEKTLISPDPGGLAAPSQEPIIVCSS